MDPLTILGVASAALGIIDWVGNQFNNAAATQVSNEGNYLALLQQSMAMESNIAQTEIQQETLRSTTASYENFLGLMAGTSEGQAGLFGDMTTTNGVAKAGDPSMLAEFKQVYGNFDIQKVLEAETGRVGGSAQMAQKENLSTFVESIKSTKKQQSIFSQSLANANKSLENMRMLNPIIREQAMRAAQKARMIPDAVKYFTEYQYAGYNILGDQYYARRQG
jgi:hypothetical protein